jgi:dienelactone hydrolase
LPLVSKGDSLRDWESRAAMWRSVSDDLLGTLRDRPPHARQRWGFLGDELRVRGSAGYALRRLRYPLTADGEWGYAWLLRPRDARTGRRPAVIALHQTHPHGKHHPLGLERAPDEPASDWAVELCRRGYVVLAPDAVGFGERQAGHPNARYRSADEFFAAHPDGSVMAKMAYDTSRAVDVLEQLDGVDASRVGCVGHSHGAYGTLFAMLADPRIRAGVMSCGLNLLRRDSTPQRWWRSTALIPRLGFYERDVAQAPIDFHHWLALLAPRPVYVIVATRDEVFPNAGHLQRSLEGVRDVYRLHGRPAGLHVDVFDGPHEFRAAPRRRAWAVLRRALAPRNARTRG